MNRPVLRLEAYPGEVVSSLDRKKQKATGERGRLFVGDQVFHTIERLDGYKRLPPGKYDLEMAYITFSTGVQDPALRVLGDYSEGRIYIHKANYPHQIQGCVAVGRTKLWRGVGRSRQAMTRIFDALGGWAPGGRAELIVLPF